MQMMFELTEKQHAFVLRACKLKAGEQLPDPERVNGAWDMLGRHMGFDGRTCEPIPGKDETFFMAEVVENEPK